jgi:hypothetical protein
VRSRAAWLVVARWVAVRLRDSEGLVSRVVGARERMGAGGWWVQERRTTQLLGNRVFCELGFLLLLGHGATSWC